MKILAFGGGSDMALALAKRHKDTILLDENFCDVTDLVTVDYFIKVRQPDVVINFAGVSVVGIVAEQNPLSWERQIKVNLIGSYNVAKACVDNKVWKLILIGSVAGKYGKAEHSAYCASKAGVISLVQSLGMEGYKAYCISPGRVDTKMREHDYPGEDKRTRLTTNSIVTVIADCIVDKYKPGDNIIVRKIGFKKFKRIDRGQPYKKYLNVQPLGTPKAI